MNPIDVFLETYKSESVVQPRNPPPRRIPDNISRHDQENSCFGVVQDVLNVSSTYIISLDFDRNLLVEVPFAQVSILLAAGDYVSLRHSHSAYDRDGVRDALSYYVFVNKL